jgi:DNA-binding transcriptional LysR family regulator
MPRAIALFRERHPAVELSLAPAEPDEAFAKLRSGECDIAMNIDAPFCSVDDDAIERTHLLDDPMYVVLPRGHKLAGKPRIKLEELSGEPWIGGSSGGCPDTLILLRACNAAGFEPRIAFHSDDYLAIQGFVAAGVGVSLIPDLALVTVRDDVVVRELAMRTPPTREIGAATLTDAWRSPAVDAMLAVLLEIGAEYATERQELALAS